MPYVKVGKENSGNIELYYEDHGSGQPVVLIHGYPLSGASWEKQVPVLLNAGYRVITYDRRGFGKSSRPAEGYNYDSFTEDLHKLITNLKLKDFTLVGFSMGGGEIARYFGKYGSKGVNKAVIMSGVPPFLLKTDDNPEGVDASVFDGIQKAVAADRYAFFTEFYRNFYNTDLLQGKRVSEEVVRASWNIAAGASSTASLACVPTWHEDLRQDVAHIDVPTLVIHGDEDRIVPFSAAGERTAKLIKGAHLHVVKGGPHCIIWTHAEEVNAELLSFLGEQALKAKEITAQKEAEEKIAEHLAAAESARAESDALNKATLALTADLRMDFVLDTLLQSLLELVPCECARVLLLEGDSQLLVAREKLRHEVPKKAPEYPLTLDAADSPFLLRILTTQNSVLLPDTKQEKEWPTFKGHTDIRSWLCVPLVASQQTLGLLSVGHTQPNTFTQDHLRRTQLLAIPAAAAIQNSRLYERAEIYGSELQRRLTDLRQTEKAPEHSEEGRRVSEDKFQKVFRSSPIPFSITTVTEGRFVDVNAAFERDMATPVPK